VGSGSSSSQHLTDDDTTWSHLMAYPLHRPGDTAGVPASPSFPAMEQDVLAYWAQDGTFQASIDQRPAGDHGSNEFVFYDGPPFANGLPHYGHLLTGYVKDIVPRFETMRGRRVERRFGWDTHGLPAELEAMSQLGIKTKEEIVELGIDVFNAKCRESVLRYTHEWQEYVTRQARWVDFEHDYKTLEPWYMESVIWAFKQLYDKGLVYEGYRVLPYCWNDQTPLSTHELRMDDDVYQNRQDQAVTVGCRLETGELALIWTTTPWTLPSNLGIAVNPEVEYVVVESDVTRTTERYLIAAARLSAFARELGDDAAEHIVERLTGADLIGRRYTPPFIYYLGAANAHRIVAADFVTTEDGTGLVHLAPGFGEDDKAVMDAVGVETVVPVGPDGRFTHPCAGLEGIHVFDANVPIIDALKSVTRGAAEGPIAAFVSPGTVLLRRETYEHSYPHCWRCRQPLIYMAVSSWFVQVTAFRDRMVELNQDISWLPEHIKDGQFGKWLEGARDWSISRNRFWGSPIPVWKSDDPRYPRLDVYGSFEELERDFGVPVTDLHRPFIDELVRPNPDDPTGRSMMHRIPDILDVWFDSGSMPYAQVHYPFENRGWFEHHYPGDFIVEYVGQTRGWFYLLHVLATALFDRPAFRTCLVHGIVLGSDGRKMSKSLHNYPDVVEVFDRDGADAMRWFLMASPILRGGNLIVTEEGIREAVRQVLLPLWNTWYFFTLYAGAARRGEGLVAARLSADTVASLPVMDRYLLARTRALVATVTAQLDAFDVPGACETVREHLDVLTNWYVRTSRDRFWSEDEAAFSTLATALEVLTRVMAPLAPLVTEEIWRGLTGGRSVHLTDWPVLVDAAGAATPEGLLLAADDELVAAMDGVREVVSVTLGLRKVNALRVRQPLSELRVVLEDPAAIAPYAELIAAEVNVKRVRLVDLADAAAAEWGVSTHLTVNARAAGPRLGRGVQDVIRASKSGDWEQRADGVVLAGGVELVEGEYELSTVVADRDGDDVAAGVLPSGGFVVLDVALTDELRAEGYARDVVRAVQDGRKYAGLQVSDRIQLALTVPADKVAAVAAHRDLIARETLAQDPVTGASQVTVAAGEQLTVTFVRA